MPVPQFTILIDGACPLCKRESDFMRRLDRGRGRLALVDIAAPEFDAGRYGTTFEAVMGSIHGVTAEGRLVHGLEAFRRAYSAVGWPWLLGWTSWPVIRPIADRAYRWFAKNRLRWTKRQHVCAADGGRCRV